MCPNPPSVSNKGWTTNFKLDTERMKLDMAAITSNFLLDQVALKEFVYYGILFFLNKLLLISDILTKIVCFLHREKLLVGFLD